jgi:hypothetical protein
MVAVHEHANGYGSGVEPAVEVLQGVQLSDRHWCVPPGLRRYEARGERGNPHERVGGRA